MLQQGPFRQVNRSRREEPWLNGDYYPLLWSREQVEQEAASRLRLVGKE